MKLLIVGSVAYDSVETAVGKVDFALGGAAVFSSIAASYYTEPAMVGIVGDDFKDEDIKFLESRDIDLAGLQRVSGKTFHWAGRYLDDMIGRETLETQLNVFEDFDPVLPDEYKGIDYVFLANIHPGLQKRVLDQVKDPKLIVMDTMNLWIDIARDELKELFPRVDVLVINDEEVRMLTEDYNIVRGAKKLLGRVRKAVIVKRGEHGSTLFTAEGMAMCPPYPVDNLVDPTGAGDSFAGAFIGYLAKADDIGLAAMKQGILQGSALASFTVEGFSVDPLRELTEAKVSERIAAIRGMMDFG